MDSLTRTEFDNLFKRIALYVNVKDAYSPEDIDNRMDEARKITHSKQLRTLQHRGFPDRVFEEAVRRPRGIEALTIRFGIRKALRLRKQMNEERQKQQQKRMRRIHWR